MFFWAYNDSLWLNCLCLFSLNFNYLGRLRFLNDKINVSSWNIDRVLQTTWKWNSWSLIEEQDGTNVSFISHIHLRFVSFVSSHRVVLPALPSPSSAVLIKVPILSTTSILQFYLLVLNTFGDTRQKLLNTVNHQQDLFLHVFFSSYSHKVLANLIYKLCKIVMYCMTAKVQESWIL